MKQPVWRYQYDVIETSLWRIWSLLIGEKWWHVRKYQKIKTMSMSQERLLYMTDLPDDVLLRIFYFLNKRELLQASLVCATWRRLARDGSLWCSLDLTKYVSGLKEEKLAKILMSYFVPMGKHLSLKGKQNIGIPLGYNYHHFKISSTCSFRN